VLLVLPYYMVNKDECIAVCLRCCLPDTIFIDTVLPVHVSQTAM